ncbi:MAG TPA: GntR family transcriptional regulator [Ktedonobacteraceae bacterium]|nr:GntR family transcriptional regulator [Ktedonobacteraceae bacterium]
MPKSQQIERITQQLREDILQGAFKPYNVLPTIRVLADQFGTTADTISKVLRNLEIEGLLVKGKGRSLRVNVPRERITTNDETFRDYMKAQGYTVTVEPIVTPGVIPATPQLAKLFRLPTGTALVERVRREIVNGIVYRYSRKYYRAEFVSEEALRRMREDYTLNVRAILEEQKPLARIQERIIARTIIDTEEAELLQAAKGSPVMEQWKINYAQDKSVVFVSLVVFNAAYFVKTYDYALGNEPRLSEFSQGNRNLLETTSDFY